MQGENFPPKTRDEADRLIQEVQDKMRQESRVKDLLDSLGLGGGDRKWLISRCARDPFLPDEKVDYLGDDAAALQAVREHVATLKSWKRKREAFEQDATAGLTRYIGPEPGNIVGFRPTNHPNLIADLDAEIKYLETDLRKREAQGTHTPRGDNEARTLAWLKWSTRRKDCAAKFSHLLDIAYELAAAGDGPSAGALSHRLRNYQASHRRRQAKLARTMRPTDSDT